VNPAAGSAEGYAVDPAESPFETAVHEENRALVESALSQCRNRFAPHSS